MSLFGQVGGGNPGAGGSSSSGPDLETIATEELGFLAIAGDAKVRLTTGWSPLPAATSSLLSIASKKGLVAAAGPDQITIATTESVRKAFEAQKEGDSEVREFTPQLKLPMPMRVSQLAFTADENYLILSAESGGGGLAVYEVQRLLSGSTSSAFELSTNGESLLSLAPNPTAEKAELCAIVTTNGKLHMANLREQRLSDVLHSQVSCVSWSSKGKQLCAGLADGTIRQMTPEGDGKANIPRPSDLGNHHVSSLSWLENNLFLAIYTTTGDSPSSTYKIINRPEPGTFTFQNISDPIQPFVVEKPPHHSLLRIRDYLDLQDLLIVSSTVSPDIGLLSRSTKPLATDKPVVGSFTTTELLDDSRRPTLPMTESMDDSTPIGLALDLSSKDKVYKPIPSDEELEESPNPLPGFWVLTHEGILCAWWFIYNDAIKQGHLYSGMASADTSASSQAASQAAPSAAATTTSAFGAPSKPAFGSASSAPAFGSPSTTNPMFGSSTKIGLGSSPWGAPSTSPSQPHGATFGSSSFGNTASPAAPAFGKPSTPGFGQSSALGAKSSPWGSGGGSVGTSGAATGPAFGQSGFASFANNATTSNNTFGSLSAPSQSSNKSTDTPSASGFASFSNQGGFASVASQNTGGSVFGGGNQASPSPFSTGKTEDSIFGTKKTDEKPSGGVFGSQPFKLESTFKPDTTTQDNTPKGPSTTGSTMFGSGFGSALDDTKKIAPQVQSSQDDDQMDAETPVQSVEQSAPPNQKSLFDRQETVESTTPTSTPAPSKFTSSFASTTPGSSLFGKPTPAPNSSGGLFGSKPQSAFQSSTGSIFGKGHVTEPETPKAKQEEPEAPLPPDTTSRLAYPLGDSSSSSAASNAPGLTNAAAPAPTKAADPPLSIDPLATPKPSNDNRPAAVDSNTPESVARENRSPSDFVKVTKPEGDKTVGGKPASIFASSVPFKGPTSFSMPKPSSEASSSSGEGSDEDDEDDEGAEDASEGSGVDVANDLSPVSGTTPGFTPQSSFGGLGSIAAVNQQATQGAGRSSLFGELGRNNAAMFPPPSAVSPRSPSPIRRAVPSRLSRAETRSVSAPGVASQLLNSTAANRHVNPPPSAPWGQGEANDPFMARAKREKAQKEKEETQPLVDTEDEERQKLLAEEVEGTLTIHEFIAHANNAPPAQESVPSQVEAVYRDINSMIDTVGLNARSVKAFVKGHSAPQALQSRSKDDLENADGWVLCEVDTLGNVLDTEVREDLEAGRVQDLGDKLDACKDLSREMHRLRAKREDLAKVLMVKMDPNQAQTTQSLPLSAEQAAQQNELRKDFTKFSKLLAEAEEALTLLKAKIASSSGVSGRGTTAVPTVEAVMRTITKMTSMVEKRSGDIDVLENQMRKMKLGAGSREGSPMVTPQGRRSIMFSLDSTPSRNPRHSFAGSIGSLGSPARGTPPRKKLSGFSHQEKGELMDRRARRQAVLDKLKESVEKKGPVQVWGMDDVE